ncbi:hypothetical protein PPS11_15071 [Pseudomonas putida S11]|nr:hypothetical protein PPS11_15071 [Pseudomonas putida S11]
MYSRHQVELAGFLGLACDVAAKAAGDAHIKTVGAQVLRGDFGEYGLFGEHPRADTDKWFFRCLGKSCKQQGRAQQ